MLHTPPNKDMGLFLALTPAMVFMTGAPLFIFCTTMAMKAGKGTFMFWVLSGFDLVLFSLFAFSLLILLPVGLKMLSGQMLQFYATPVVSHSRKKHHKET